MKRGDELYRGKAKTVYQTDNDDLFILEFRDDTSAFNGERIEQLAHKGAVNNQFNAYIMQYLSDAGVPTHFQACLSPTESIVKRLDMIPVECVIRNVATGSLSRRLGVEEGTTLSPPVFEFFLKDDALGDPMVNDSHIISFGWASAEEIALMKQRTHEVNELLRPLFAKGGMNLIDFKLEFGRYDNELLLGDEFTPDGCRIWDSNTQEKLDKDRFRQNLGNVIESYKQVAERLGIEIN